MKLLFLLKKNNDYGTYTSCRSGLLNSCQIVAKELKEIFDVDTNIEICVDGNEIDKYVTLHKPNRVVIEAIWVTPAKLRELKVLHPSVQFIVRVHSKTPFLATEGMSITWLKEYALDGTTVAFNNEDTSKEYQEIGLANVYLPNLYPTDYVLNNKYTPQTVDVGCFGSIRPMKNQLLQAIGAIRYGNANNKIINFHINAGRVEQRGEEVLKNLRAIFKNTPHQLIEHGWLDREDFLNLVRQMDVGMQVSLSESFNIVTADFVKQGIPIIVSEDVSWMPSFTKTSERDSLEIAKKLKEALRYKLFFTLASTYKLKSYNYSSTLAWGKFLIN